MAKAKQIAHQLRTIQQMATQSGPALACKPADQLARQFPKHADSMALAGELRLAAGQPELAAKRLKRADRLRPRDPKIRALLGRALRLSGEPKAALPCLRDAYSRLKGAPWALELAAVQRDLGQDAEAEKTLRSALEYVDPAIRFNLANLLRETGRPDEAVTFFQELIARGERQPALHNNLGLALLESGQTSGAVEQFDMALELDPAAPITHMNLARAFIALAEHDRACHSLDAAAALAADSGDILHAIANLQRDAMNLSAAISNLRSLAASSADARHDLIATLEEDNQLEDAKAELEAIDLATADPRFTLLAAKLMRRSGDVAEARKKLDCGPLEDAELEQRRLSELVQCCDLLDDAEGVWSALMQRSALQNDVQIPDSDRYQRFFDYYERCIDCTGDGA